MAAFETNAIPSGSSVIAGRISHTVHLTLNAVKTWNKIRVTRKVLSNLSDRELDDIGLCRADINKL